MLDATFLGTLHDMLDVSTPSRKKSWQSRRERVSLLADMAIKQRQVAETLARLRRQHELTQEQASERAGVAVRQWQRWEGAETMPHPRNLERLAEAFDIPVSEFFADRPVPDLMGRLDNDVIGRLARIEEQLTRIETTLAAAIGETPEDARHFGDQVRAAFPPAPGETAAAESPRSRAGRRGAGR